MEKKEEIQLPTFTPLEDLVIQQEATPETPAAPAEEAVKPGKEEKVEVKGQPKDVNPYAPLGLEEKQEATSGVEGQEAGAENEVSKDDAIDNYNKAVAMGIFIPPTVEGEGDYKFDGSAEATQAVYENTINAYEQKGKDQLFEKIADPYLKELVNYGINAGEFGDLKEFGQTLKSHASYSAVDTTDVEQAKKIVREHLTAIGNRDNAINTVINSAVDEDVISDYAEDAKAYFLKQDADKIVAQRDQDAQTNRDTKRAQKQYEQNFRTNVVNAFNNVELQNGQKLPEYQYKIEQIKQNPSDFIELLKILGKYEAGKGFSIKTPEQAKTEKIQSIYDIFNGTSATIKTGGATDTRSTEKKKYIPEYNDEIKTI